MDLKLKGKEKYDKRSDDYKEGWRDGMSDMSKMVLSVFAEHPELSKEETMIYIKENL